VIVFGIEIEGAKGFENAQLFASFHVFRKGSGYGFLLGLMAARTAGFFDEVVVKGQVRSHVYIFTH
jgi:hypothetical protein